MVLSTAAVHREQAISVFDEEGSAELVRSVFNRSLLSTEGITSAFTIISVILGFSAASIVSVRERARIKFEALKAEMHNKYISIPINALRPVDTFFRRLDIILRRLGVAFLALAAMELAYASGILSYVQSFAWGEPRSKLYVSRCAPLALARDMVVAAVRQEATSTHCEDGRLSPTDCREAAQFGDKSPRAYNRAELVTLARWIKDNITGSWCVSLELARDPRAGSSPVTIGIDNKTTDEVVMFGDGVAGVELVQGDGPRANIVSPPGGFHGDLSVSWRTDYDPRGDQHQVLGVKIDISGKGPVSPEVYGAEERRWNLAFVFWAVTALISARLVLRQPKPDVRGKLPRSR